MLVSTAVRIAGIIIVAKAVLIGIVCWRRAEILGRPLHIGADNWIGLITIIAIGVAIAAGVYVAARHYSRGRNAAPPPATRSSGGGPNQSSKPEPGASKLHPSAI